MDQARKIFGIGLGRTGSRSLATAMHKLGYRSKHSPKHLSDIWKFDFLNDIRISCRYKFLDFCFPEARFILTVREIDSWIESNRRWSRGKGGEIEDGKVNINLKKAESRFGVYGITYFDEGAFRKAYFEFNRRVLEHFEGREDGKLLIMNICGGDGWEKLCKFLGCPVPNIPFPLTHQSKKVDDET